MYKNPLQFTFTTMHSYTYTNTYQGNILRYTCRWRRRKKGHESGPKYICRVGQNRIYTYIYSVYLVISKPKIPYVHRIYMVLAKPIYL